MFIKDLVMWRHHNVILENSDITTHPWQRLAISDNLNHLSTNVIWNILVLNIKGKINKITIRVIYHYVSHYCIPMKVVSSNPAHVKVYSIQDYVIKFVIDFRQISGFLGFPPPIKLNTTT